MFSAWLPATRSYGPAGWGAPKRSMSYPSTLCQETHMCLDTSLIPHGFLDVTVDYCLILPFA